MPKFLKALTLLLTVALVAAAAGAVSAQTGSGKLDADGYSLIEISNLEQLDAIRHSGDSYKLTRSLNFNDPGSYASGSINPAWTTDEGWDPIDWRSSTSTFDGNGHTISNLYINRLEENDRVGFFSFIGSGATVRNVGIVNVDITGDFDVTGDYSVGGLVGENEGTVSHSYVTGTVSGNEGVGGLVGLNEGTVTHSYAAATVSGYSTVGGLVGYNGGSIIASYAAGTVSATVSDATRLQQNGIGGLAGHNSGSIIASYAATDVTAIWSAGTQQNFYGGNIGGLVGRSSDDGIIVASYANITLTASNHFVITGGLVGYFLRCHAGIVGTGRCGDVLSSGDITDSYWDSQLHTWYDVGPDSPRSDRRRSPARGVGFWMTGDPFGDLGGGKTTAELQSPTGYTGIYAAWGDTEAGDVWDFGSGSRYPALKADLNGDGVATWQEFGDQPRSAREPAPAPVAPTPTAGGKLDADGDGLIEISNLEQLDAIRHDPDGDGAADQSSGATAYNAAFPGATQGACNGCKGYELTRPLDFEDRRSYRSGQVNTAWTTGEGWLPIGRHKPGISGFDAIFDGNGHTISNLYVNRSPSGWDGVGLFSTIWENAAVRNLGVANVDVTGERSLAGALAGEIRGAVNSVYVTGEVSGGDSGGLAGQMLTSGPAVPSIVASYADVEVSGSGPAGGLVGAIIADGTITASYASGEVTGDSSTGGLIGYVFDILSANASYWDINTSGQEEGAGSGYTQGVEGQTTVALQLTIGYTGIYADWDETEAGDAWNFGTGDDYPTLKNVPPVPKPPAEGVPPPASGGYAAEDDTAFGEPYPVVIFVRETRPGPQTEASGIYAKDTDGNGLIEISTLEQLDAIRHDPDGNGAPTNFGADAYAAAFSTGASVCDGCNGYELTRSLDFDDPLSYASGSVNAAWTTGEGWEVIEYLLSTFDGNAHTISNLYINRPGQLKRAGLFKNVGGTVRDVGLVNIDLTGGAGVGGLAIYNRGTISGSFVSGRVISSHSSAWCIGVGGLVGMNIFEGTVVASYSNSEVRADGSEPVGGLAGSNMGAITASYATGTVAVDGDGRQFYGGTGGLVGSNFSIVSASYSVGNVSGEGKSGGLVGTNYKARRDDTRQTLSPAIDFNYWDTQTSGLRSVGVGDGYSTGIQGKTTSELQSPTDYNGIYATWNDTEAGDVWDFGGGGDYPKLKAVPEPPPRPAAVPFARNTGEDFSALGINDPEGIWSDGKTMWVSSPALDQILAFDLETKARDAAKDISDLASLNGDPQALWSDGGTMWVGDGSYRHADGRYGRIFAYELDVNADGTVGRNHGIRDAGKEFDPGRGSSPRGIWSEEGTVWLTHYRTGTASHIRAYRLDLDQGGRPRQGHGDGVPGKDFTGVAGEGLWSDGTTLWVAKGAQEQIHAYDLETGVRVESKDFNSLGGFAQGIWSDGKTMWVAIGHQIHAYNMPPSSTNEATPDPVTPEPVTPDPVTPDPVTPDPVTPDPVTPDPVTPDPPGPGPSELTTHPDDLRALRALYNATDGKYWRNNDNWLTGEPLDQWHGVTTGTDGRVIKLVLRNNRLSGTIPAELGRLDNLERLYLTGNQLSWTIPAELGRLDSLEALYLNANSLSGAIPEELGRLTNLTRLNLNANSLSGAIPEELGRLTNLTRLNLSQNRLGDLSGMGHPSGSTLSGAIPQQLSTLENLNWLDLSQNQLSGEIPWQLGQLTKLTRLYLNGNELSGEIPWQLGNLTRLQYLYLRDNDLRGGIPVVDEYEGQTAGLGSLRNLKALDLSNNGLSGAIPAELGSFKWLQNLNLSNNGLESWWIPQGFGHLLPRLKTLDLSNNGLEGTIPPGVGELPKLKALYLNGNSLSGAIPAELGRLTNLTRLNLSNNGLESWWIPQGSDHLRKLKTLDLSNNGLKGTIPSGVGELPKLEALYLNGNSLKGEIPEELGRLTNLTRLNLSRNRLGDLSGMGHPSGSTLSGEIPSQLGDLEFLRELDLSQNKLSGAIPAELGNLFRLEILRLHDNEYTDGACVPTTLASAVNAGSGSLLPICLSSDERIERNALISLYALTEGNLWAHNDNWWSNEPVGTWHGVTVDETTGRVISLDLSSNNLQLELPPALGNLEELKFLDLSKNRLSGEIPGELSKLKNLNSEGLHLYGNNFNAGCAPRELWGKLEASYEARSKSSSSVFGVLSSLLELISGYLPDWLQALVSQLLSRSDINKAVNDIIEGKPPEVPTSLKGFVGIGNVLDVIGILTSDWFIRWVKGSSTRSLGLSVPPCAPTIDDGPSTPWYEQTPETDKKALEAIRNYYVDTKNNSKDKFPGWWNEDIRRWHGVTVDDSNGRVVKLNLSERLLKGGIPPEVGDLGRLEYLNLSRNRLTGPIPEELGHLSYLKTLALNGKSDIPNATRLTGKIPAELGNLTKLEHLILHENNLRGGIPPELGNAAHLGEVNFSESGLEGCLPPNLQGNFGTPIITEFLADLTRIAAWAAATSYFPIIGQTVAVVDSYFGGFISNAIEWVVKTPANFIAKQGALYSDLHNVKLYCEE